MAATPCPTRRRQRARIGLLSLALGCAMALCGCAAAGPEARPALPSATAAPAPAPPTRAPTQQPAAPTEAAQPAPISDRDRTLASLRLVDPHPLYTMTFYGGYSVEPAQPESARPAGGAAWACSLFAALADPAAGLYGRNFDWEDNPALLLFTDPPDGYASVSMVDISYLGFDRADLAALDTPAGREPLLRAPLLPFDGMNEHGLAVGMAAVEPTAPLHDSAKPTVGSLRIIRLMLDRARDTEEALAIFSKYNIDFSGGPPIHYLIADRGGRAAVVELKDGALRITRGEGPWQAATNFYLADSTERERAGDWRYAALDAGLSRAGGTLTPEAALGLLADVAQPNTRWSIVYGVTSGEVHVAMGRRYEQVYSFLLAPASASVG